MMVRSMQGVLPVRRRTIVAVFGMLAFTVALGVLFNVGSSVIYLARLRALPSSADVSAAADASTQVLLNFRFRGRTRFLHAVVDPAELVAARQLDTSCVFSSTGPVRAINLSALVSAQSRSATVQSLAGELRRIADELDLDGDEYVELIARFVQQIPYGVTDNQVYLPVEVVAEGSGVCDDKSVLLAALLLHERYDTAIWVYDAQAHAAVGVRCSGPGTLGSGYALIETTRVAYVGEVTGSLGSRAAWRRKPHLVRLGGTRTYSADLETAFIVETLERAEFTVRMLEPYARSLANGPARWSDAYAEASHRHRDSQRLAQMIVASVDDRARVFELITASGGR